MLGVVKEGFQRLLQSCSIAICTDSNPFPSENSARINPQRDHRGFPEPRLDESVGETFIEGGMQKNPCSLQKFLGFLWGERAEETNI